MGILDDPTAGVHRARRLAKAVREQMRLVNLEANEETYQMFMDAAGIARILACEASDIVTAEKVAVARVLRNLESKLAEKRRR